MNLVAHYVLSMLGFSAGSVIVMLFANLKGGEETTILENKI
jgi:hypothetical protein